MCFFKAPKLAPQPPVPTINNAEIQQAADRNRRRRANAYGFTDTIQTSPLGVTAPATAQPKTLLGQ